MVKPIEKLLTETGKPDSSSTEEVVEPTEAPHQLVTNVSYVWCFMLLLFLPTLILFWTWQDEVCYVDKDTDVESEMFQESVEFQECFEITSEKMVRLSKPYISRLVSTV